MSIAYSQFLEDQHLISRRETVPFLAHKGQKYQIEQIAFTGRDYKVYELETAIELNGKQEQYLAVTENFELFSIDVLADPKDFLTTNHGQAWVVLG